jgi:translocation and assembly module TamA
MAASAAAICAATAASAEPRAAIEGVEDSDLRERIERAIGQADGAPGSRFEARRRANAAAEDATALLRSEGYYGHTVEPSVTEGEQARPVIRVDPGPRFTIQAPDVAFVGAAPEEDAADAARSAIGLTIGEPGRAPDIIEAEGRVVAALQARGYADAKAEPRQVVVDHADRSVRPTYQVASGPLVRMDGIAFDQVGRTDRQWLLSLVPWKEGEVYEPDDVAELERRLLDTGVYDSVTVALAPQSRPDGLRPVVVSLADRPRQTLDALASVSTSEGISLEGRWTRYNRFGRADTFTNLVRLGTLDSRLETELQLPHFRRAQRTLRLNAAAFRTETEAFDETGVRASADLTQRFGRTTYFTYGASVEGLQTTEFEQERNFFAVTGWRLRARPVDDPLDPKRGYRIEGGRAHRPDGRHVARFPAHRRPVQRLPALWRGSQDGLGGTPPPRRDPGRRDSRRAGEPALLRRRRRFGPGLRIPGGGAARAEREALRRAVAVRNLARAAPQPHLAGPRRGRLRRRRLRRSGGSAQHQRARGLRRRGRPLRPRLRPVRADIAIPLNKREGEAAFQIYLSIGQAF